MQSQNKYSKMDSGIKQTQHDKKHLSSYVWETTLNGSLKVESKYISYGGVPSIEVKKVCIPY